MAKRRAEDPLVHSSAAKRCCAPLGAARSPPSLSALLGRRCRKRPHCSDDEPEGSVPRRVTVPRGCSGPEDEPLTRPPCSSAGACSGKRVRRDCSESNTSGLKQCVDADGDINSADDKFNSFQYWRVPLPELDLTLLADEEEDQTKDKSKVKGSSFDTMET